MHPPVDGMMHVSSVYDAVYDVAGPAAHGPVAVVADRVQRHHGALLAYILTLNGRLVCVASDVCHCSCKQLSHLSL